MTRLWILFTLSQQTVALLWFNVNCRKVGFGAKRTAGPVSQEGLLCCPISILPSFSLWQIISPHWLRFSSHTEQEPSPPSEELGELIKTYSGMRVMPIVQGIVKTLSGVQFSHPSRRWMTANWNRCREELLAEATENITGRRMVFLRRRGKKPFLYGLARKEGWGG